MAPGSSAVGLRARIGVAVLCAGSLGLLAATVLPRFTHRWPLEWLEGATRLHVQRLLAGDPLYVRPSADFVANLYPPLSYYPAALSAALLGGEWWVLRLPSLICLVASIGLVGLSAARLSRDRWAAPLAAALWVLGYGYTGAFMDLARVDALFVLLLCLGVERTLAGRPLVGLCSFALCAWAKQHGLIFLALGSAHLWCFERQLRGKVAALWAALALGVALTHWASDGWFGYYTFLVPGRHGSQPSFLLSFLVVDVCLYLPVLAFAAFNGLWRKRRRPRPVDALLVAGLLASALGRSHVGGFDNVRLPAYALLCIAASVELWRGLAATRGAWVGLAVLCQCGLLLQAPTAHLPTVADAAAFAELDEAIATCSAALERPAVLAPDHAGWLGDAGLHTMALSDLQLAGGAAADRAQAELISRLGSDARPPVVVIGESFPALRRVVASHYQPCAHPRRLHFATGYDPPRPVVYRALEVAGTVGSLD